MARQEGIIKLTGTLGEISFYRTKDGYVARKKGGFDGERIKTEERYAPVRKSGSEFGNCSAYARMISESLEAIFGKRKRMWHGRLNRLFSDLRVEDTADAGKDRTPLTIIKQEGTGRFSGFEFYDAFPVRRILASRYWMDPLRGGLVVDGTELGKTIHFPRRATHVGFQCGWARIDFENNRMETDVSERLLFDQNSNPGELVLLSTKELTGTGMDFCYLAVSFFELAGGRTYDVSGGGIIVV